MESASAPPLRNPPLVFRRWWRTSASKRAGDGPEPPALLPGDADAVPGMDTHTPYALSIGQKAVPELPFGNGNGTAGRAVSVGSSVPGRRRANPTTTKMEMQRKVARRRSAAARRSSHPLLIREPRVEACSPGCRHHACAESGGPQNRATCAAGDDRRRPSPRRRSDDDPRLQQFPDEAGRPDHAGRAPSETPT